MNFFLLNTISVIVLSLFPNGNRFGFENNEKINKTSIASKQKNNQLLAGPKMGKVALSDLKDGLHKGRSRNSTNSRSWFRILMSIDLTINQRQEIRKIFISLQSAQSEINNLRKDSEKKSQEISPVDFKNKMELFKKKLLEKQLSVWHMLENKQQIEFRKKIKEKIVQSK